MVKYNNKNLVGFRLTGKRVKLRNGPATAPLIQFFLVFAALLAFICGCDWLVFITHYHTQTTPHSIPTNMEFVGTIGDDGGSSSDSNKLGTTLCANEADNAC